MAPSTRIIVIGAGKMGLPMARHLLAAGHEVSVVDPQADRLALAREAGLAGSTNLLGPVKAGTVFLSSLPDDAALLAVAATLRGLMAGAIQSSGTGGAMAHATWIDTSTVSPEASARAAAQVTEAGIACLRCTVSGNNHMAEAAQLTVMASGPKELWMAMEPLLAAFAPQRFHLGLGEEARLMKLVVNLMIAQTAAMLSEALTLGQAGGLNWQQMWQVIGASAVGSPIVKAKGQQLSQHDYTPTFTVPQMLKDVDLILGAGNALNVPLPQTALTRQAMLSALAQGLGDEDYAVIIKCAQRAAGLPT